VDPDKAFERFRDFVIDLEVEGIKVHQVSLPLTSVSTARP
jgi:hypothetical protein